MKKYKIIIGLIFAVSLLIGSNANASLYQYYNGNLPTIQERAIKAAECGIFFYKGTKEQNISLEQCFNEQKLGSFSVVTGYQKTLRLSMSASQSFIPVSSLNLKDGTTLSMATLGGDKVFLDIDPGGSKEEIVMCTGIDNTAVNFTGCTRGLAFSGTSTMAVASIAYPHNASVPIVMSNVHYVYEQFVDINAKDQTIQGNKTATGTWTFTNNVNFGVLPTSVTTTPTLPNQLITLDYLGNVSPIGGPNASEVVKGLSQLATGFQAYLGASTGISGARLVIPSSLVNFTPSTTSYTIPISDTNGKLSNSFGGGANSLATLNTSSLVVQNPANASTTPIVNGIPLANASGTINSGWSFSGNGIYGTAISGTVDMAASTTLTKDSYYYNLTIENGIVLNPNGYRIFVQNNLTFVGTGKIASNGGNGGNGGNASGTTGGSAGSAGLIANTVGTLPASLAGKIGVVGTGGNTGGNCSYNAASNGVDSALSLTSNASAGGTGGRGDCAGGTPNPGAAGTRTSVPVDQPNIAPLAFRLFDTFPSFANFTISPSSGAGGGGAGGINGATGGGAGGGGGSGASGGIVWVAAKNIITTSNPFIQANGGNGGTGGNGVTANSSGGGGGGGGGSGNGGVIILIYSNLTGSGTYTATAGTLGTGGTAGTGAVAGSNGGTGSAGSTYIIQI